MGRGLGARGDRGLHDDHRAIGRDRPCHGGAGDRLWCGPPEASRLGWTGLAGGAHRGGAVGARRTLARGLPALVRGDREPRAHRADREALESARRGMAPERARRAAAATLGACGARGAGGPGHHRSRNRAGHRAADPGLVRAALGARAVGEPLRDPADDPRGVSGGRRLDPRRHPVPATRGLVGTRARGPGRALQRPHPRGRRGRGPRLERVLAARVGGHGVVGALDDDDARAGPAHRQPGVGRDDPRRVVVGVGAPGPHAHRVRRWARRRGGHAPSRWHPRPLRHRRRGEESGRQPRPGRARAGPDPARVGLVVDRSAGLDPRASRPRRGRGGAGRSDGGARALDPTLRCALSRRGPRHREGRGLRWAGSRRRSRHAACVRGRDDRGPRPPAGPGRTRGTLPAQDQRHLAGHAGELCGPARPHDRRRRGECRARAGPRLPRARHRRQHVESRHPQVTPSRVSLVLDRGPARCFGIRGRHRVGRRAHGDGGTDRACVRAARPRADASALHRARSLSCARHADVRDRTRRRDQGPHRSGRCHRRRRYRE